MIELQTVLIGQYGSKIGSAIVTVGTKAHKMLVALAIRYLEQAQTVPVGLESHGFGVHRNRAITQHACWNIFFVKKNCH